MATAPPFVQTVVTPWDTSTTPKDTTSFSVQAGDVLVFYYAAEGADAGGTPSQLSGTATIGTLTAGPARTTKARLQSWTCAVTGTGTIVVRFSRTGTGGNRWGGQVRTWRGSAGVGVSNSSAGTTTASSVTLTGVAANSAVDGFQTDFNAAGTTGHAWNSGAGTATETLFQQNNAGASYTAYSAYYADSGTAGNKTVGMTGPGGQDWNLVAIEILAGAGGTTQVSQTRILKWDIANQIAQTRILKWDIRAQVSQTRTLLWDIVAQVSQTRALLWDIAAQVQKALTLRWDIFNMVSKPVTLLWDVGGNVSRSLTVKWDIANQVSRTLTAKWDISGFVSRTLTAKWDISGFVSRTLTVKWDASAFAGRTTVLRWTIVSAIAGASGTWRKLTGRGR